MFVVTVYPLYCTDCCLTLQARDLCLRIDDRVSHYIKDMVILKGVRHVGEMKRHLAYYVENDLFASGNIPEKSDARYWPSNRSIINAMQLALRKIRFIIFLFLHTLLLLS